MSLTLTTSPVSGSSPNLQNVFAGFESIVYEFSRQDTTIINISQATDNKINCVVSGDLSEVSVDDYVYIYSQATSYTYDGSFQVDSNSYDSGLNRSTLVLDGEFVQLSGGGYMNYKQSWYAEIQLIDLVSSANILGFNLSDSGTAAGIVKLDVGIAGDLLSFNVVSSHGVDESSRVNFKVKYRESWTDNRSESYTTIAQDIIVIYASADVVAEEIDNNMTTPIYYEGYKNFVTLVHSDSNDTSEVVFAEYDTTDINDVDVSTANALHTFASSDIGQLNLVVSGLSFASNEKNIRFNFDKSVIGDYDSSDYDSTDYDT